ncbi:glutamate ligase domain-containing protein, partial [Rhodopirellula sallentina]|uniref:glutamate ligase domain-containing protein n=1 Tax=Rhodopirellula sallentina TaxID=1263869 RepID=UPI0028F42A06
RNFQIESVCHRASGADPIGEPWGSSFELVRCQVESDTGSASSEDIPDQAHPSDRTQVSLLLEGEHQIANASIAIVALDQLGVSPSTESLDALARLQIEARLERFSFSGGPAIILDAAHNPDSIAALLATIRSRFAGRKTVGVFGTSVDKDATAMLKELHSSLDQIVLTRYHGNPRYVPTETLAQTAQEIAADQTPDNPDDDSTGSQWSSINEDPLSACRNAIDQAGSDGVVVICGSFFLAAELRPWLLNQVMQEC